MASHALPANRGRAVDSAGSNHPVTNLGPDRFDLSASSYTRVYGLAMCLCHPTTFSMVTVASPWGDYFCAEQSKMTQGTERCPIGLALRHLCLSRCC